MRFFELCKSPSGALKINNKLLFVCYWLVPINLSILMEIIYISPCSRLWISPHKPSGIIWLPTAVVWVPWTTTLLHTSILRLNLFLALSFVSVNTLKRHIIVNICMLESPYWFPSLQDYYLSKATLENLSILSFSIFKNEVFLHLGWVRPYVRPR